MTATKKFSILKVVASITMILMVIGIVGLIWFVNFTALSFLFGLLAFFIFFSIYFSEFSVIKKFRLKNSVNKPISIEILIRIIAVFFLFSFLVSLFLLSEDFISIVTTLILFISFVIFVHLSLQSKEMLYDNGELLYLHGMKHINVMEKKICPEEIETVWGLSDESTEWVYFLLSDKRLLEIAKKNIRDYSKIKSILSRKEKSMKQFQVYLKSR